MAAEDEKKPTAADKGKGKATNGEAEQKEVQKDKDGKPIDDKKGAPAVGTLPTPDGCLIGKPLERTLLTGNCRGAQRGGPAVEE